jgi:phosphotriesterase-related protein
MEMGMSKTVLRTVRGDIPVNRLGLILPHEHLFTDLRGPNQPDYAIGDPEAVVTVLKPYLEAANKAGVTALVECSTGGVGRNVNVLKRLAESSPIHIVAPTGVYREAFTPARLRETSLEALVDEWVQDLTRGIEGTEIRAGFLKMAVSDEGITQLEVRNLQAAVQSSLATGAAIASHTIGGALAMREMDILEEAGLDLHRFIWVHANAEQDVTYHLKAAQRGAYVEFDGIGASTSGDEDQICFTLKLVEAGYAERILLSHDAGWYDPSQPDGQPNGGIRGYTALVDSFLPALRKKGLAEEMITLLTKINPANAFAMTV